MLCQISFLFQKRDRYIRKMRRQRDLRKLRNIEKRKPKGLNDCIKARDVVWRSVWSDDGVPVTLRLVFFIEPKQAGGEWGISLYEVSAPKIEAGYQEIPLPEYQHFV